MLSRRLPNIIAIGKSKHRSRPFERLQDLLMRRLIREAIEMDDGICLLLCCDASHDDVIKWKKFPRYWPCVRGIHRPPVNSPHKGQWRGALMFFLICAWTNGWVNNRDADDLRPYRAHYDVTVKRHCNCKYTIKDSLLILISTYPLSYYFRLLLSRYDQDKMSAIFHTTFSNISLWM